METTLLPVTREKVESLVSSFHSTEPDIVSIYLDNRTLRSQKQFQSTVNSLMEDIIKSKPKRVTNPSFCKEDADLVKEMLLTKWQDLSEGHSCGVALFIQAKSGIKAAFRLGRPTEDRAMLGRYPIVAPLFSMIEESIGLLLLQKQEAKFFVGTGNNIHLAWTVDTAAEWEEDGNGRRDLPKERTFHNRLVEHVKEVNNRLLLGSRNGLFDHLIIACKSNIKNEISDHLHPYVQAKLLCFKEGDYYNFSNDKLLQDVVEGCLQDYRTIQEQEKLKDLQNGIGTGLTTNSVDEVLEALWEERVDELVYTVDCAIAGYWGESGFLHTQGGNCPLTGDPLHQSNNILERAIQKACRTGAKITPVNAQINGCLVAKLRAPTHQMIQPQPLAA